MNTLRKLRGKSLTLGDCETLLTAALPDCTVERSDEAPHFRHYLVLSRNSAMGYVVAVQYYRTSLWRPVPAIGGADPNMLGVGYIAWWGRLDPAQVPGRYRRMRAIRGAVTNLFKDSIEISSERYYGRRDAESLAADLVAWHQDMKEAWRDIGPLVKAD